MGVASVVLMGAVGSARAADEWFVLSEQTIKAADPSVEIKSSGGRWEKDIKQIKFSVEGADVEITKAVLHWNNRPNDDDHGSRSREGRWTDCSEECSGTPRRASRG